jgi:hypothetical protein
MTRQQASEVIVDTTLRIARAYGRLLSRADGDPGTTSLAWIGDCEIRMQISTRPCSIAVEPIFILFMFDHGTEKIIDVRACYNLAEGAAAFDAMVSR